MSFKDFAAKEFSFTHGASAKSKPADTAKDVPAATPPAAKPETAPRDAAPQPHS